MFSNFFYAQIGKPRRKLMLSIGLYFLFSSLIYSQENCADIPADNIAFQNFYSDNSRGGSAKLIKVYFHIYAEDNGITDIPTNRPEEIIAYLNSSYSGTNFEFYHNPCDTRYEHSTAKYYSTEKCDIFESIHKNADGVDIHLLAESRVPMLVANGIPGDEIILCGTYTSDPSGIDAPYSLTSSAPHEMGHVLGLFHTHYGTCNESGTRCNGDQTGGGNAIDGDYVDDTNTDGRGSTNFPNCDFAGNPSCDPTALNPPTDNFMSYYPRYCRMNFTSDQATRMHALVKPELIHPYREGCCGSTDEHVVTGTSFSAFGESYGGNIVIKNGGKFIIKENHTIYLGQNKSIIIEAGGELSMEENAEILPCVDFWDKIEVFGTFSTEGDDNQLVSTKNGIIAHSASFLNLNEISVLGTGINNLSSGVDIRQGANVSALRDLTIKGFHTGISSTSPSNYLNISRGTIEQCRSGIILQNAPARIHGYTMNVEKRAISTNNSPGMLIENNQLNVYSNGDTHGINMWWCDASIIRKNTIGSELSAPMTGISLYLSNGGTINDMNIIRGERSGIFAFGTDFSIIQNDISATVAGNANRGALTLMLGNGNQILNNYVNAQNVTHGINTILCSATQIENNDITTYYAPTYHRAAAIKSEGSNGEIIRNNNVTSTGNANGILANNTAGNTYDCNHASVQGTKDALSVLYNSQGQSVKGNTLSASGQDLLIRSIIGEQVHEGNEFCGGSTLAEDQDIAAESIFYVNSTYPCHIPSNIIPNSWFTDETGINNYYKCANSPGPNWIPFWDNETVLCAYYQRIINTYGYGSTQYIRMIQTMLRYGQQRVNFDLPDCIKDDPILPECWEQLTAAEHKLSANDDTKENEKNDLAQRIAGLSDAYEAGNEENYLAQNENAMMTLISTLLGAKETYDLKIGQVRILMDDIDCTDSIMQVALPILEEYVHYLETKDKSAFDYSRLINYSRLCADEYGPYIHLARGMVFPITNENFDQYDDCRLGSSNPRKASSIQSNTMIFPNPSHGLSKIVFDKEKSGYLEVINISGQIIQRKGFDQLREVNIDLASNKGVYLIYIHYSNSAIEVLKHMIIN